MSKSYSAGGLTTALRISTWTVVGFTIAGLLTRAPLPSRWLLAIGNTLGGATAVVVLLAFGLAGLVCWIGAMIHVTRIGSWSTTKKSLIALLLFAGNFPAAVVYYFVVVRQETTGEAGPD